MKLLIANKAWKGQPVGSEIDIADRHAKVLVAIGRATYMTRDMVAEVPRRRGRPPKVVLVEVPAADSQQQDESLSSDASPENEAQ